MNIGRHIKLLLATGGYLGYMPVASGTFGSLPGILLYYFMAPMPLLLFAGATVLLIGLAVFTAHWMEKEIGSKDPGCIVIDEIAGMVVTLSLLPFTWKTAIIGFFVFRFFDILKPYPIHVLDEKLPGGWGIVADDILAGVYGNLCLHILFYVISPY